MKIPTPVIVPTVEDETPCKDDPRFLSPLLADHAEIRTLCRGSKSRGLPACPFIGWCEEERQATQREHGNQSIDGTWAGVLYLNGAPTATGRQRPGRPRKEGAA